MFFVFNKSKIKSYLISLSTIVILLMLSVILQNNMSNKVLSTSIETEKMPICKVDTKEKEIALTINCIENVDNIDDIVDTLSKMHAKATFFVPGELIEKNPNAIKKIINNGNEIGNLSDKYVNLKQMKKEEIKKQIQDCNKKIEGLTMQAPKLFRAPYGEYSNDMIEEANNQGMKVVGWNIDSLDYNELSGEEIWERINENLTSGSILLVHNEYIQTSLEGILHNIEQQGYKILTVSELISK